MVIVEAIGLEKDRQQEHGAQQDRLLAILPRQTPDNQPQGEDVSEEMNGGGNLGDEPAISEHPLLCCGLHDEEWLQDEVHSGVEVFALMKELRIPEPGSVAEGLRVQNDGESEQAAEHKDHGLPEGSVADTGRGRAQGRVCVCWHALAPDFKLNHNIPWQLEV